VEVAVAVVVAVVVALLLLHLRLVEWESVPALAPVREEPAARIRKPGNLSLFNVQLSFVIGGSGKEASFHR